jgi:hypothetical protein
VGNPGTARACMSRVPCIGAPPPDCPPPLRLGCGAISFLIFSERSGAGIVRTPFDAWVRMDREAWVVGGPDRTGATQATTRVRRKSSDGPGLPTHQSPGIGTRSIDRGSGSLSRKRKKREVARLPTRKGGGQSGGGASDAWDPPMRVRAVPRLSTARPVPTPLTARPTSARALTTLHADRRGACTRRAARPGGNVNPDPRATSRRRPRRAAPPPCGRCARRSRARAPG